MKKLTITIENLSEGKEKGYCATIKELGNSVIMADSIKEIFELMPDLIASAKKNNIGIFQKAPKKRLKIAGIAVSKGRSFHKSAN